MSTRNDYIFYEVHEEMMRAHLRREFWGQSFIGGPRRESAVGCDSRDPEGVAGVNKRRDDALREVFGYDA